MILRKKNAFNVVTGWSPVFKAGGWHVGMVETIPTI